MAIEKGSAFLLKIGDGAEPPAFATMAGLRTTQLSINGETVVVTSKDSGGWRELLSGAGVRHVSVAGAGVFTGSAAEARMRGHALAGTIETRFDPRYWTVDFPRPMMAAVVASAPDA
ncbi:hypothetical protein NS355_13685 [Sphingomonas yabuuchiae]|uniref:Non-contractile tail sheath N-terminal domain-containing protein n=1 Tax=Sphingomonas yabuuchiae TaxID=172044 RepID=A0A147INA9_9SPHN|nr:phage tail protein [Sphingomonas yabuuchiae]KTT96695.1 hypothetical protein NS355_13685 [Sphingomonas yabuuchiae]